MAICKKGYTLETKTCGMVCEACEFYDERTKKERQQAKADAWAAQLKADIAEYAPEDCEHCKYCDGRTAEEKAEALMEAGYGNVKEAVKDFAEKLKKKFIRLEKKYGDEADRDKNTIPNLQFEFYKPVVEREVAFANGQATMANKAQDFIDELIKEVCGG